MFNKLRNRFLLVNLVFISVMMLVSFATIYIITYQNVYRDIRMELYRVSDFYRMPDDPTHMPGNGSGGGAREPGNRGAQGNVDSGTGAADQPTRPAGGNESGGGMQREGPPQRSVSFMIQTDVDGQQTSVSSKLIDMEDSFYTEALQTAIKQGRNEGQFKLNGNVWMYTSMSNDTGHMYVFMDVTSRQGILNNLIYTFTLVGLVMLVVIYFLSRYFANRSIAPVKEAFEKQKQFIADASHELKTPLAVINTNTDVLLANSEETIQSQAKWLHYIKSETERMAKLTNDLLYLTEMEHSRPDLIQTTFNISEAVENIVLTMEAVMFEKDIRLEYTVEPKLTVHGNREQIIQVVLILLDNAIKYSQPKGMVEVSLAKQHNDVVLAVTNSGEGIAPEHLERIFDRFYRTDASRNRKQGGYGLGLAIARSIVRQHKGEIYAKSVLGEGATFYVKLS